MFVEIRGWIVNLIDVAPVRAIRLHHYRGNSIFVAWPGLSYQDHAHPMLNQRPLEIGP